MLRTLPQQYNILRILRGASKPIKVQTIKDRMIESPNATRLMDKLHDKGLIERVRCPHDRKSYLSISLNRDWVYCQLTTMESICLKSFLKVKQYS